MLTLFVNDRRKIRASRINVKLHTSIILIYILGQVWLIQISVSFQPHYSPGKAVPAAAATHRSDKGVGNDVASGVGSGLTGAVRKSPEKS